MMKAANDNRPTLNTAFLLMAQYGGKAIIPVDEVCRDYCQRRSKIRPLGGAKVGHLALQAWNVGRA